MFIKCLSSFIKIERKRLLKFNTSVYCGYTKRSKVKCLSSDYQVLINCLLSIYQVQAYIEVIQNEYKNLVNNSKTILD